MVWFPFWQASAAPAAAATSSAQTTTTAEAHADPTADPETMVVITASAVVGSAAEAAAPADAVPQAATMTATVEGDFDAVSSSDEWEVVDGAAPVGTDDAAATPADEAVTSAPPAKASAFMLVLPSSHAATSAADDAGGHICVSDGSEPSSSARTPCPEETPRVVGSAGLLAAEGPFVFSLPLQQRQPSVAVASLPPAAPVLATAVPTVAAAPAAMQTEARPSRFGVVRVSGSEGLRRALEKQAKEAELEKQRRLENDQRRAADDERRRREQLVHRLVVERHSIADHEGAVALAVQRGTMDAAIADTTTLSEQQRVQAELVRQRLAEEERLSSAILEAERERAEMLRRLAAGAPARAGCDCMGASSGFHKKTCRFSKGA